MLDTSQEQAVARILTSVAELKATDLHLTVGNPPILRVEGRLKPLNDEQLMTPEVLAALVDGLLNDEQKAQLQKHKDVTLSYTFQDRIRFRMNVYYQKGFPSISLRFIPDQIPDLESLGLPSAVSDFTKLQKGLVLLVGPFGSGKTTTIASILQKINVERGAHIVTVENPIEYIFVNNQSIVEQREVGRDAESMLSALELADREDVDIIFVSGMKTPEVIQKTIELSASDRLIFASYSADSIVHGFENIIASYPLEKRARAQRMLSEVIQGVLGQRLIPRVGGGLVVVPELLIPTTPARALIREGAFSQLTTIMQTSRDQGMVSLDTVLSDYVKNGVVSPEDALAYASDKEHFGSVMRE